MLKFGFYQHFCSFSSPYVIPVASPEVAYTVPNVARTPPVVNTPTVAYAPTMYIANPTANPDAMFFGMGGMYGNRGGSYLNNNIGGKVWNYGLIVKHFLVHFFYYLSLFFIIL